MNFLANPGLIMQLLGLALFIGGLFVCWKQEKPNFYSYKAYISNAILGENYFDKKDMEKQMSDLKSYVDDQILKKALIVSGTEIRPEQEAAFKKQTIADYEFSNGNNQRARDLYLEILNMYPASDELQSVLKNNIGATYANSGQRKEAVMWYKKAQEFLNYRRNVDENLASTYFYLGDYENAIKQYQILLKKNPKDYKVNNQLGTVYSVAGQPDKAIEQFMIAINNNFHVKGMYFNIALNYFQKGSAFDLQGITFLEKETTLYPDNATAIFQLGAAYCWQKDFNKGIPLIEQAVMIDNSLLKSFPSFGLPEVNFPESDKIDSIKILPGNNVQITYSKRIMK